MLLSATPDSSFDYTLLILLAVIGLTVLAAAFVFIRRRSQQRSWEELAGQLGLSFTPGGWLRQPNVNGVYRGRSLQVTVFMRGAGQSRTSYTGISLGLRSPSALTFSIYEENVFNRIGKSLGAQDIETGDQELDYRFIIKGQPETEIVRLFSQINLRQKLLDTPDLNIKLSSAGLAYERRGVQTDMEYLHKVFDLLSDLADSLERLGR